MPDHINLLVGWIGMLLGVVAGGVIGLVFADDEFMGGYSSFRRRLTRLGHISFFGLGLMNIAYGLTVHALHVYGSWIQVGGWCLIAGAASMPIVCFLSAWRAHMRLLFPIPVALVLISLLLLLKGWR